MYIIINNLDHQPVISTPSLTSLYLQVHLAEFSRAADHLDTIDPVGVGSDEMAVGRAGYIAGSLWLHQTLGKVKYFQCSMSQIFLLA